MALTIAVRSGDSQSTPSISFDAPRIVIGRGEGCEVRLPDPSVSHRHASVRQRGTEYILVDEGSTNGTFLSGVRLSTQSPHVIRSGDFVRVGRVWLELRIEQVLATHNPQLATKEIALGLVASALEAAGENALARAFVIAGPDVGSELFIREFKRCYVIGRGSDADLALTDNDASRRHVEVERRGDKIFVRDLGSKNGALLNGEPLAEKPAVVWRPESVLRIGQNQLRFADPIAEALAELERAADERMEDSESPPAPPTSRDPGGTPATLDDVEAAAAKPEPRRREPRSERKVGGWTATDFLVAALALAVLAASGAGLLWIFGG